MKDWYKKSKVIDIEPDNEARDVFVVCTSCGRWATSNSGKKSDPFNWKFYYQMDPEEQAIVDASKSKGHSGESAFATQICDFCKRQ